MVQVFVVFFLIFSQFLCGGEKMSKKWKRFFFFFFMNPQSSIKLLSASVYNLNLSEVKGNWKHLTAGFEWMHLLKVIYNFFFSSSFQ